MSSGGAATLQAELQSSVPNRVINWQEGDGYHLPSPGDGQIQQPLFSAKPPSCSDLVCSGGSGVITFHISRANATAPSPSWRSMMILTSNVLKAGGTYDCVFQTSSDLGLDAMYTQNLIWQDHSIEGSVNTALGLANYDGNGTKWYMNTGGAQGVSSNPEVPHTWEAPYVPGETDDWEIQWKNTSDSSGWVDLYRNGKKVDHYSGPNVVADTRYNVVGIGLYEWDWRSGHESTLLSQTIKFNNFTMYSIPGPIEPLSRQTAKVTSP